MVDALAKLSAAERQAPEAVIKVLKSATAAVRHAVMLLGCVTHAANNHLVTSISPDGSIHNKVIRDASQAPKSYKRKASIDIGPQAKCTKPAKVPTKAWSAPAQAHRDSSSRKHNSRVAIFERACTAARVNEIGASATCTGKLGSASARLELLTRRVRSRLNPDGE